MHYFTKLLLTLNQRVWGSSPQGITIEINKCESTFLFHMCAFCSFHASQSFIKNTQKCLISLTMGIKMGIPLSPNVQNLIENIFIHERNPLKQ